MMLSPPPALPVKSTEPAADVDTSPIRNHQIGQLAGNGSFGFVWPVAEDRVLKEPKIYSEDSAGLVYSNMVNRTEILNEKAVYGRLGSHHGIIQCFKTSDQSIQLAFANQGDLSTYIQTYSLPSPQFRANWIRLLVDTFSHAHARRVVIQDVALRNILVHDNSLKLSDIGESFLLPLDTNMAEFSSR
jgi:serine/threonine protein kinase